MIKPSSLIQSVTAFFNHSLWQTHLDDEHPIWRWFKDTMRLVYVVVKRLASGDLTLRAMSLVFTTLLSLVPLIAVAFSVLKAFGVHNQIEPLLMNLLQPLGAKAGEITANIIGFVENVKVAILGSLGMAMLFYTIIMLIQKIESAFNFVWRVKQSRSIARRFTDYLSVVMIGPVLVFSAMGLAATVMNNAVVQKIQSVEPFGSLILLLGNAMPYIMIILTFTFLYTFIPNTKVKLKPALIGAMVAGILWVTLGKLFAAFVASSSNYTAIYSSFAILFFFMIWLYLGWLILLTGAQVAYYLQYPNHIRFSNLEINLSPRLKEQYGLLLMVQVARQFQQQPALSLSELETKLKLNNEHLMSLVIPLKQAGLLAELEGEEPRYQPAQDITKMTVEAIFNALRMADEDKLMIMPPHDQVVSTLFSQIKQVSQPVLANNSLSDLINEDR